MSPNRFEPTTTSNRSRLQDELRGQRVDVLAVHPHVRVAGRPFGDHLVPERHRVHDPVGLRRRRDVAPPGPRQLEGEVRDPAHPDPGEHRLLDRHLVGEAAVDPAADLAVLALDVLPHDHEVDVGRRPQRALDAVEHLDRAEVDVLPERPPDRDQQPPQRHVVRDARPADGAEQNRVELAQRLDAVGGHHRALAFEPLTRPVEIGVGQLDSVFARHRVEHRTRRGDHLTADPVAGDHGDPAGRHPPSPSTPTIIGSSMMIKIAPATSKSTPERIMVVIGTAPDP